MDQTPDVERHDALLGRVAAEVSRLDGSEPGGALIGPRLLFLAAFGRLCDERLVKIGTAIELLRRATLAHREPQREAHAAATGDLRLSSTLVGDTHLAASFRLLADDGDPRTVAVLASAMATAAEGETERLIDGGGHRRRGAFAVGAVDVGISVCNLDAGEARRLRTVAEYVGEAHERGDVTARAGIPGYTGNGRRSLLVSLLEHVGKADVIAPEPGAQSL